MLLSFLTIKVVSVYKMITFILDLIAQIDATDSLGKALILTEQFKHCIQVASPKIDFRLCPTVGKH